MYNTLGSVFYLGCQWLITVLVVSLGNYEDAGVLSLCMSITNVSFTIATFGMRDFVASDYNNKYSTAEYMSTRIFTSAISTLAIVIFVLFATNYSPVKSTCIITYMLFRDIEAMVDMYQAIQQREERMNYTFISFALRGVLLLGGFALVLSQTHNLLSAIITITIATLSVVLLFDIPVTHKLEKYTLSFSLKRSLLMLKECIPLMANSLCSTFVISLPRSIFESINGSYQLGIYASIATPAVIIQSAALWLYTPAIAPMTRYYVKEDKKSFFSIYRKIWLILATAFASCMIGAAILGKWALVLLFNDKILPYWTMLFPVLGTTFLIAIVYYTSAILTIVRNLKAILYANIISALVSLIVSYPLIKAFSMNGINYSIFLSMGINVLFQLIALIYTIRRKFE